MRTRWFLSIIISIVLVAPTTFADNSSNNATELLNNDSEYNYVCSGDDCDVEYDSQDWYSINSVTGDVFSLEIRNQGYPDLAYLNVEAWDENGDQIDWGEGSGDYVYSIPDTSTVTFYLSGNGIMYIALTTENGWGGDGTYYWINVSHDTTNRDSDGDSFVDTQDDFPNDPSQWADSDGDGYGDRPVMPNGDFFPNDPTQWSDFDDDGFGDNSEGNNGDQCPELYGKSTIPAARGCPDTDNDGVVDPFDAFPEDFYQQTDNDGDGWGDNQSVPNGDRFPDDPTQWEDADEDGFGDNSEGNNPDHCIGITGFSTYDRNGCLDSDGDGYSNPDNTYLAHPAGMADAFVNDSSEWLDTDGDSTGDNSDAFPQNPEEDTDSDNDSVGDNSDAFPNDYNEWLDSDGDGTGDNSDAFPQNPEEDTDSDNDSVGDNSDAFPNDYNEWLDSDGDGTGDNSDAFVNDSGEWLDSDGDNIGDNSDDCKNEYGDSTKDLVGCVDSDGDGYSDENGYLATLSSKAFDDGDFLSILILLFPVVLLSTIGFILYSKKRNAKGEVSILREELAELRKSITEFDETN